jgi:MoxR-vWA-beta-propeller ternary system domain bpX4
MMTPFAEFLTQLFDRGEIVFRAPPRDRPSVEAVAILAEAFQAHALEVAGPPIAFDATVATAAAEFLRQSSWALVNRDERASDLERRLKLPTAPLTPSEHLSADLLLRYAPQVVRRARGLDATDPLVVIVSRALQSWPLSGVLSDVADEPLVGLDFGGHPGLLLLYAERALANDRPGWRPSPPAPAAPYDELVRELNSRRGARAQAAASPGY